MDSGLSPGKGRERLIRRGAAAVLVLLGFVAGVLLIALPGPDRVRASHPEGVIYVDRDAMGANDGSSWGDAFRSLQAALDHATSGDEIWVAEGVYTPTKVTRPGLPRFVTFQLENGVGIYGGFAATETMRAERDWEANVTVLSGDLDGDDVTDENGVVTDSTGIVGMNSLHVVTGSGTDETAVLDGVTVTAGKADEPREEEADGGGLYSYVGSPTLTNVIFSGNWAEAGGGMGNYGGSPMLTNVSFRGNGGGVSNGGAGMSNSGSPTLVDVTFIDNTAGNSGGGIYSFKGSLTLTNVSFIRNRAGFEGGGLFDSGSDSTLTNVTFDGNSADIEGGAIFSLNDSLTLTNARFTGNETEGSGGALSHWGDVVSMTNAIFSGNSAGEGGGIYSHSKVTLIHATLSGNSGGGFASYGRSTTIRNSILWGNSPCQICKGTLFSPTVEYSLVEGGYSGTGNIDADPRFVDADGADDEVGTVDDDLRLQPGSPAIDAAPCEVATDLDGNPRPGAGSPFCDMGAYETQGVSVDLTIAKSADPATATAGQSVTYTLVYSNAGSARAEGVVITDVIPSELTAASYSSSGATITPTGSSQWIWQVEDLAPGAGGRITITGTLDPSLADGTIVENQVSIGAQGEDATPEDNGSTASISVNAAPTPTATTKPSTTPTVATPTATSGATTATATATTGATTATATTSATLTGTPTTGATTPTTTPATTSSGTATAMATGTAPATPTGTPIATGTLTSTATGTPRPGWSYYYLPLLKR